MPERAKIVLCVEKYGLGSDVRGIVTRDGHDVFKWAKTGGEALDFAGNLNKWGVNVVVVDEALKFEDLGVPGIRNAVDFARKVQVDYPGMSLVGLCVGPKFPGADASINICNGDAVSGIGETIRKL